MVRQPAEAEDIAKKVVKLINERFEVRAAFLFGSYFKGNFHEGSDIDVAVVAEGVDEIGIDEKMEFISLIQKKVGAEVEIHLYPSKMLSNARPTNFMGYIMEHSKKIAA